MPKTFITRLKLIDELIQKRNTGNPAALAAKAVCCCLVLALVFSCRGVKT